MGLIKFSFSLRGKQVRPREACISWVPAKNEKRLCLSGRGAQEGDSVTVRLRPKKRQYYISQAEHDLPYRLVRHQYQHTLC